MESEEICCVPCDERLARVVECLQILELPPGASSGQVKAAFRDLAKVWHPDRFDGDQRMKTKAHERFATINMAHRELTADRHMLEFLEAYIKRTQAGR